MENYDFMIQLRRPMQTSGSDATFIFQIARQVISKSTTFSMNRQDQYTACKNILKLIDPYDFD